jgi:hypothetical protein
VDQTATDVKLLTFSTKRPNTIVGPFKC